MQLGAAAAAYAADDYVGTGGDAAPAEKGTYNSIYGCKKEYAFDSGEPVLEASDTTLTVKGAAASGNVYGGYAVVEPSSIYYEVGVAWIGGKASAKADRNTVILYGGRFEGSIYGGYSFAFQHYDMTREGFVSATGNTVRLCTGFDPVSGASDASPQFSRSATVIDGGCAVAAQAEWDTTICKGGVKSSEVLPQTGNTLYFDKVQGMEAKNIKNFSILTYDLPAMSAGDAVLTLYDTEATDLTGATVEVINKTISLTGKGGSGEFKEGDEVVLLANASGFIKADDSIEKEVVIAKTNATLQYELKLQKKKDGQGNTTAIVLTIPGDGDDGSQDDAGDAAQKDTARKDKTHKKTSPVVPGTKAIAEGALAGLALVNEASNACLELARDFSMQPGSITPFIHVQGSSASYETGSSVHLNAVSLMAGIGAGLDTGFGNLSAGAFFEYGKGSYTTSNTFDNDPDINGDGDAWYMGGGILAKMDFIPTGPGHFYVEGSAHMGQLHNEYDSKDLLDAGGRAAKFDMDSPYYALHGGAGYVWDITDAHELDVYGRYIWTRVQGTDDTLTTGDKLEYDDMDSSLVRFGARYTYKGNERFKPYVGVAYEHEFAGSCDSKTFGYSVAAPSFEGDTGMGELGITMKPSKDLPLSVNLGVQGYVGQKQGISGSCLLKYEF